MKKILTAVLLSCFVMLQASPGLAEDARGSNDGNTTAVQVVEGLHQLLLKAMKTGKDTSCPERFRMLQTYILKSFDFPLISRIVLGRYWRKMDEKKRHEFVEAFSRMTIATYAERFDSYSGESFKTKGSSLDPRGHLRVETVLVKKDGEQISLDYTCRNTGGHWKIVSVSARGVNDLSLKRADYSSFLKRHTIDELIAKLKDQAQKCIPPKGSKR